MNRQPILTIAIPTYNGSRTIGNMMDILLHQIDKQLEKEIEILVVDNCSSDKTPEIVSQYIKRFPIIKYMRNEKNIGADGNFLYCMRLARGKYIHLLSDDDILTENSLKRILDFLKGYPELGIVYLGTANFYSKYRGVDKCVLPIELAKENIVTKDKKEFMNYAKHYWGFLSSFIILRERFLKIDNPEQYYGTYWLQSYIHILCATGEETFMGVVKGVCIGAGVYITQSNYDTGFVDGISYRKMLDFAIANGFEKKQLDNWYIDRLCLLASHGIIKEKATGNVRINKKQLFHSTKNYFKAWIRIYPMMMVPKIVCKIYMRIYRKKRGVDYTLNLNRENDVMTKQELRIKNINEK